jgi:hypothetical protein
MRNYLNSLLRICLRSEGTIEPCSEERGEVQTPTKTDVDNKRFNGATLRILWVTTQEETARDRSDSRSQVRLA